MTDHSKNNNKGNRQRRQELRRQRAESFFWIYYQLGPERSLEKLHNICTKIGLKRALSTLKSYSINFDWQNKILEIDTKLKEERELSHMAITEEMNKSQYQDGKNMRAVARAGLSYMAQVIQQTGRLELSAQDISTLMREGTKIERLAMGQPTERLEAIVYVYNVMLMTIVQIFNDINSIRDPIKRRQEFARRIDEFRDQQIKELEVKSS